MIKKLLYFVIILSSFSCSNTDAETKSPINKIKTVLDSFGRKSKTDIDLTPHVHAEEYLKVYIIIADTSGKYVELRNKMINLKDKFNLKIDTLGRGFDDKKNKICLPDDDKDEIYAGDYFPREGLSNTLSIEYLDYFDKMAGRKTMALFVGIFDTKKSAAVKYKAVKIMYPGAYLLETDIFTGCKH